MWGQDPKHGLETSPSMDLSKMTLSAHIQSNATRIACLRIENSKPGPTPVLLQQVASNLILPEGSPQRQTVCAAPCRFTIKACSPLAGAGTVPTATSAELRRLRVNACEHGARLIEGEYVAALKFLVPRTDLFAGQLQEVVVVVVAVVVVVVAVAVAVAAAARKTGRVPRLTVAMFARK